MANPGCLNRRLISAILHAPNYRSNCPTPFPCRHSAPKDWIRTITSSTTKYTSDIFGVSFGKENDGLIASYTGGSIKTKGRNSTRSGNIQPLNDTDDFEISGFVDRSKKKPQTLVVPLEDALRVPDDGAVSSRPHKKSRTSQTQQNDTTRRNKRQSASSLATRPRFSMKRERGPRRGREEGIVDESAPSAILLERSAPKGLEPWMIQKNALKDKFKEGWSPRKKISPDAMEGIKGLHDSDPTKYTTEFLADQFKVSPEAIRRILKSKWLARQSPEKMQERRERWARRHDRIWDQQAELGLRPKRTKAKEIEDPDQFERDLERRRILGDD